MDKTQNTQDSAQQAAQKLNELLADHDGAIPNMQYFISEMLTAYLATLPPVILNDEKMKDSTAFSYAIDCKQLVLAMLDPTIMLNATRKVMETEVNRTSGGRSRWSELTVKNADATKWLLAGMTSEASDGRYSISDVDKKTGAAAWKSHLLAPSVAQAKWEAAGHKTTLTENDFILLAHKRRIELAKQAKAPITFE